MVSCVSLYSCLTSATEIPQVNGDTHAFMSANTFIPIKPMTNQKLQWAGDMRPGFIFTMRDRNSNLYTSTKENAEDEVEINKKILTRHWSSTYDLIDGFVVELIATFFICFLSIVHYCN